MSAVGGRQPRSRCRSGASRRALEAAFGVNIRGALAGSARVGEAVPSDQVVLSVLGPPERAGRRMGHPRGQTSSMMTDAVRWMEAVCQQLPVQGDLVGGLVRIVERTADFRALIVSCSLGRGNADEFSDVDAAITHTMTDVGRLEVAATDLAAELGDVLDAHVHGYEGFGEPTRRVAAVYSNGGQLDLLLIPVASRSHHLAGEEVVVVDKDGHVSEPFIPPVAALAERTSKRAVEYTHSAWWFLGDVAKYLERRSWYEAVERVGVVRDYLLRLVAIRGGDQVSAVRTREFGRLRPKRDPGTARRHVSVAARPRVDPVGGGHHRGLDRRCACRCRSSNWQVADLKACRRCTGPADSHRALTGRRGAGSMFATRHRFADPAHVFAHGPVRPVTHPGDRFLSENIVAGATKCRSGGSVVIVRASFGRVVRCALCLFGQPDSAGGWVGGWFYGWLAGRSHHVEDFC